MKVLIIGATGATGKALLDKLIVCNEVSDVLVVTRRSTLNNSNKIQEIICDFDSLEDYAGLMHADVAISCLGTTLKQAGSKENQWKIDYDYQLQFAQICAKNKVDHFVLLSALGADASSSIFYSKMKGALEEAIKQLPFSRIDILQPSLLIRPNSDRFFEKLSEKILKTITSVGLLKSYTPLKVEDLAEVMLQFVLKKPIGIFTWKSTDILAKLYKK